MKTERVRLGLRSILQILAVELDTVTDHYDTDHPIWEALEWLRVEGRSEGRSEAGRLGEGSGIAIRGMRFSRHDDRTVDVMAALLDESGRESRFCEFRLGVSANHRAVEIVVDPGTQVSLPLTGHVSATITPKE